MKNKKEEPLSSGTVKALIRFANAVKRYESEPRSIYRLRNGSFVEAPAFPVFQELDAASDDLKTCSEPLIKILVHTIQMEHLEKKRIKIEDAWLAVNELVALGHKFQGYKPSRVRTRRSIARKQGLTIRK